MADPSKKNYGIADPTLGSTHRHLEAWIRQAGQEVFTPDGGAGCTAEVVGQWFEYWNSSAQRRSSRPRISNLRPTSPAGPTPSPR